MPLAFLHTASSATKPLGVWTLAGILALAFATILVGSITLTTWLERHRRSSVESVRHLTSQEEKTHIH